MSVPSSGALETSLQPDQTEGGGPPLDETRIASRWSVVFARFRRRRLAMFGLTVVVLLFVLAFVGPYLTSWSYTDHDFNAFLQGPSSSHYFGTTQTGGDVYALTMRGMQKSLVIGILVALLSTGMAAIVGSFAGYFGGWVDRSLMWFVDLLLVLPSFLIIAILSPTFKGKTWLVFVVLLAAFLWLVTARIVRGMTISLANREYVLAARFMGVPAHKIIFRHILPNISGTLIVAATLSIPNAIIAEAALSFLGLGLTIPNASWGLMLHSAQTYIYQAPRLAIFPGVAIVIAALAFNLLGDALRDVLDPRLRGR